MRELDLEAVPMIGVVKPPLYHNQVAYLLVKGREDEPVYLDSYSPVLRLIQMIRDETHRYAVTYHRKRRELRDFTSELSAIPGVGDKRKTRLLRHFGSIHRISEAQRRGTRAVRRPQNRDRDRRTLRAAKGAGRRRERRVNHSCPRCRGRPMRTIGSLLTILFVLSPAFSQNQPAEPQTRQVQR